ncbi:Ig-like domain-containing protein, partial [bacterium]|nr:Ig-like domain-containing protein [bacterium]
MKPKPKNLSTLLHIIIATLATLLTLLIYFSLITKNCTIEYPTTINPSEEFCLQGYYLLPNHYTIDSTLPVKKIVKDKITILDRYDLFAQTICLKPTTLLPENKGYTLNLTYINQLNLPIFQKQIEITTKEYPQVKGIHFEQKVNYDHILKYETNYSSHYLNYHILYNENSVPCEKEEDYILCDISDLNLEQGNTYELNLVAKYDNEIVNELDKKEVEILISVKIEESSIENKEIIQTPTIPEIRIGLNKEVEKDFLITLEDTDKNPIQFEHLLEEKEITISPTEELKQSTTYYLKINNLVGLDSSHMDNEYTLEFSIDDGPTITGTNISSAFSISNNIVLTFNQNIKEPQDIKNIIKLNS